MIKRQERPKALRSRLVVAPPSSGGSGREARRLLQIRMPGGGAIAVAEDVDLGTVEYFTIPVAILPHRSWHLLFLRCLQFLTFFEIRIHVHVDSSSSGGVSVE